MGSQAKESALGSKTIGLWVMAAGIVAIAFGALVYMGWLSWFGHLPGDIRIESDSTRIYVPITTMIIVSLISTLALWIVRRFMS